MWCGVFTPFTNKHKWLGDIECEWMKMEWMTVNEYKNGCVGSVLLLQYATAQLPFICICLPLLWLYDHHKKPILLLWLYTLYMRFFPLMNKALVVAIIVYMYIHMYIHEYIQKLQHFILFFLLLLFFSYKYYVIITSLSHVFSDFLFNIFFVNIMP